MKSSNCLLAVAVVVAGALLSPGSGVAAASGSSEASVASAGTTLDCFRPGFSDKDSRAGRLKVDADLYAGPDFACPKNAHVSPGETVEYMCRRSNDGRYWTMAVKSNGSRGWLSNSALNNGGSTVNC
ncbi:hypothetical protein [Actinosynnema sp. NPDC023587]|uniref:hypothetical protein n=1 Tax=Actinosynnema sp. NPDC023587 TaxID=3154695 RepID=UPI0033DE6803